MKRSPVVLLALIAALLWWFASAPRNELHIADAVEFGDVDPRLVELARSGDVIASTAERSGWKLPGYDDVVVLADGEVLASGMDGWIWRGDPATGEATPWIDAPLMPAGLRISPADPDLLYFCSSVLHGQRYPAEERVGLYALRLSTEQIVPIVLDVPGEIGKGDSPEIFPAIAPVQSQGRRPLAFCNDLDVSNDGQRIYFSEPFAYEGAAMGGGAVGEAIALGRNGRLWLHDLATDSTRLLARGFRFLDGVLIENPLDGTRESSVLITETTHFQIQRLSFSGPRAGESEILWRNLPGMPDGLDRDADGNVWVGLLSLRSTTTNWVHAHPWIKPLLLRLPAAWMPKGTSTGVLAFEPRSNRPLFIALHDGSSVRDISVAIPAGDRVYLASFDPEQRGLVSIPRPGWGGGDRP